MLSPIFENIPDELKKEPHWVNWRVIERDGKTTKPPYQPNGQFVKSDDPATWSTYDAAMAAADRFDGVGFVLTNDDPYVALDYDKCYCRAFNLMDPQIEQHVRGVNSYTELSPSGRGIRQIVKASLPVDGKRKGLIEIYQSGRYVTITGHVLAGFSQRIESRQEKVDAFYNAVFGSLEPPPEPAEKNQQEKVLVL